jgi:hypothetical protein
VVTGSSIASTALPKNPLTPPVMPASSEARRTDGSRLDVGSIDLIAKLRLFRMAASSARPSPALAAFGIRRRMLYRLAGIFCEARSEIGILEQHNSALQSFPMHGQERIVDLREDQRCHSRGRSPLRLAKIAEPLLIIAVNTGLISPLGSASASATVFMPATIA